MQLTKFAPAMALAAALAGCGGAGQAPLAAEASEAPRAHAAAAPAPADTGACPAGAVITALTPDAGQARDGSVFSATLYDPALESGNTTHQPRKLKVRVTLDGRPVQGCAVGWQPRDGGNEAKDRNGWVFPNAPATDFNGIASAWWTAGSGARQTLNLPGVPRTVPMPDEPPVAPPPLVPGLNVVGSQGALGSALDIPAASTTPGTKVEVYPTHGGVAQQWTVAETAAGSGLYTLVNPRSGLALAVAGGVTAPGSRVSIETVDGSAAQQWRVVPVRAGVYAFVHVASGLVLDTQGGAIAALTPVVIATTPDSSPTQEWSFASLAP